MYLLGSTADDYLSNALEYITTTFNIPEALAGVTLLAFGNGAPDVFASLNGAEKPKTAPGKSMTGPFATLLGGAFFLVTVVTSLSLRASENREIKVTKSFFLREMSFLIMVYLYLITIFFSYQKIDLWVSLGFFLMYITYVILVIVQSGGKREEDMDEDRSVSVNVKIKAMDFVKEASVYQKKAGEGSVSLKQLESQYEKSTTRRFSARKN